MADLLTTALDKLEKNLPEALGNQIEKDWQNSINKNAAIEGQPIPENFYYLGGAMRRFRNIANKHYRDMEKELGNEKPEPLFPYLLATYKKCPSGAGLNRLSATQSTVSCTPGSCSQSSSSSSALPHRWPA